ncbi:hypothetical protein [Paenibacillus elgii]|uniref:hypothetical protein n=1 Tax=Paenibacillus elgii TaxID=189691 RepID=UPI00203AA130|nr:hypothetical protein [Paenibacillus elgii]MCM3270340.1 hypothetical protein [Paenibacillus elgii]
MFRTTSQSLSLLSALVVVFGVKFVLRSSPKKADMVLMGITFLIIIAAEIHSPTSKYNQRFEMDDQNSALAPQQKSATDLVE